jgi:hypothetical protein
LDGAVQVSTLLDADFHFAQYAAEYSDDGVVGAEQE